MLGSILAREDLRTPWLSCQSQEGVGDSVRVMQPTRTDRRLEEYPLCIRPLNCRSGCGDCIEKGGQDGMLEATEQRTRASHAQLCSKELSKIRGSQGVLGGRKPNKIAARTKSVSKGDCS